MKIREMPSLNIQFISCFDNLTIFRLTSTIFGIDCVSEKPIVTALAMITSGVEKTFLTNATLTITSIRISNVDIPIAFTRFAKVSWYKNIDFARILYF